MESHLHEWLNLLLRWLHFIAGVAWIGASFYFNWLENRLDRTAKEAGIAGELWAIHGGGFYHLKKYDTGPDALPAQLHWFKWEAYATWLSGFALLVVVYYLNPGLFLLDADTALSPGNAIALGILVVFGSWFVYDALCRSPLQRMPALLAGCVFAALVALAWGLSAVFSGRAAYIHTGAAIGTLMVGNVLFVIIPAQKAMVAALAAKRRLDPALGAAGLLRSRHNNYLTLPVLFIMISAHFPGVYGSRWNWVALALLSLAGWLVRHYFNIRHLPRTHAKMALLPLASALIVGVAWLTAPPPPQSTAAAPRLTEVVAVVRERCASCHARTPIQAGFSAPPLGLALESTDEINANAARIYHSASVTKTMPIGNLTGMTEAERQLIAAWYHAQTSPASP